MALILMQENGPIDECASEDDEELVLKTTMAELAETQTELEPWVRETVRQRQQQHKQVEDHAVKHLTFYNCVLRCCMDWITSSTHLHPAQNRSHHGSRRSTSAACKE
jgi:hypothetical protein